MAILEADQKKTEVAVNSIQLSDSVKAPCSVSINCSNSSSTSAKSFKTYNLYKNIKDFHFFMPSGWNDLDIGIFVHACKKNLNHLYSSDDNVKWGIIANSGAELSHNKTLFTIYSCMDLAKAIKAYVSRNKFNLRNNEAFRNFSSDIADLLPIFTDPKSPTNMCTERTKFVIWPNSGSNLLTEIPNFHTNIWSSPIEQTELMNFSKFFNCEPLARTLSRLIKKHIKQIRKRKSFVWPKIVDGVTSVAGIQPDILSVLSGFKESIIYDVLHMHDPHMRQQVFSCIINTLIDNFEDIFDYISPPWGVRDELINKHYSESEEYTRTLEASKLRFLPHLYNCVNSCPELKVDIVSLRKERILAYRRVFSKSSEVNYKAQSETKVGYSLTTNKNLGEPSSTYCRGTSITKHHSDGSGREHNDKRVKLPSKEHVHFENIDEDQGQSSPKIPRLRQRNNKFKTRPTPARVLPPREVKNKKVNTLSNNVKKPQPQSYVTPESPESFRGFDEVDVHTEEKNVKILRSYTLKRTVTKTVTNPDTTTRDDDSDSGLSNSHVSSNAIDEDRSPRNSREPDSRRRCESQTRAYVAADTTMQPTVKLEPLNINYAAGRSGSSRNHFEHFRNFGSDQNIHVESTGMRSGIVSSVYKPTADLASSEAGPSSSSGSRKNFIHHSNRARIAEPGTNRSESEVISCNYQNAIHSMETGPLGSSETRPYTHPTDTQLCIKSPGEAGPSSSQLNPPINPNQTTVSQSVPESAVALIDSRSGESQADRNYLVELYHRKPLWLDPFMAENRKQQAWKLHQFQKISDQIIAIETKKVYLMEKLLDNLSKE